MDDLVFRISSIVKQAQAEIENQLWRSKIEVLKGTASFVDSHQLQINDHGAIITKTAGHIIIAVGTVPHHPPGFQIDGEKILDSDQILALKQLPQNLAVIGGGIIGIEYASMFAVLGIPVTLLEQRNQILDFIDREIVETLEHHLRSLGVTIKLGEEVSSASRRADGQVEINFKSSKSLVVDAALVTAGRQATTNSLNLEAVGIQSEPSGRISVNDHFQSSQPHIYAVGDIAGFPALASTAMNGGRIAAAHAFRQDEAVERIPAPFGIYTIPEISLVGETEASLTLKQIPYESGIARYSELARGQLAGDQIGMLKLLFHRDTAQLLGVQVIGEAATELIHLGQSVLHLKGGLNYLCNAVFNYPTLTEAYQTAALDGLNKIRSHDGTE